MTGTDVGWTNLTEALRREAQKSADRQAAGFPHFSEGGRWHMLPADRLSSWRGGVYEHGNWTFGFWYGVMWLSAALAGTEMGAGIARKRLDELRSRAGDLTTHDLGFIFWPSLVLGQRLGLLTDEQTQPAVLAARTLADRFNERGGYIQAFGPTGHPLSAGTSTIDTMMNLPLLWWAGTKAHDERLLDVACRHAHTSRKEFIRPDGSTYHLNRFDPESGRVLERGTFQGAAQDSCWSRGQAWAVSGFALAYAATRDTQLLEASEQTAEYFWQQLPQDGLPPWDFAAAEPDPPRDASATAIAALGALVLAAVHPRRDRSEAYHAWAGRALTALAPYISSDDETDGILQRSSYSVPHGLGLNGATAWGDFYFSLAYALLVDRLPLSVALDGPQAGARPAVG